MAREQGIGVTGMTSEIPGRLSDLVNDLDFRAVGYGKLTVQTANRENAGSWLATLGAATVSEQRIVTFSGAG
jgi:hypothetical protein